MRKPPAEPTAKMWTFSFWRFTFFAPCSGDGDRAAESQLPRFDYPQMMRGTENHIVSYSFNMTVVFCASSVPFWQHTSVAAAVEVLLAEWLVVHLHHRSCW